MSWSSAVHYNATAPENTARILSLVAAAQERFRDGDLTADLVCKELLGVDSVPANAIYRGRSLRTQVEILAEDLAGVLTQIGFVLELQDLISRKRAEPELVPSAAAITA